MSSLRKNRNIIIAAIISVVALIIIITLFSGGSSTNNGYTASYGSTLHVKEKVYKFDLNINSALAKATITNGALYNGDYAKLGIHVNNKDDDELLLSTCTLELVDENKQTIAATVDFVDQSDNIATKNINPNTSLDGYLYFDNKITYDDIDNNKPFDDSTITRAKYLKVGVIATASVNDGKVSTTKEYYYLELR